MPTDTLRIQTPLRATACLLVGLVAAAATPDGAEAQRRDLAPDSIRRIQEVAPRHGPIGTVVHLHTENMPLQARIHVGVGARHIGFEALSETQQGEWGDITAELAIPEYWTWDRPLVLIIFNGLFSPIGLSQPFHVTNADGMVQRTGHVTDEGGSCLGFRDQDDYFYALDGPPDSLSPGDSVVIEGTIAEQGRCGEVDTIRVSEVVPAPPTPPTP